MQFFTHTEDVVFLHVVILFHFLNFLPTLLCYAMGADVSKSRGNASGSYYKMKLLYYIWAFKS